MEGSRPLTHPSLKCSCKLLLQRPADKASPEKPKRLPQLRGVKQAKPTLCQQLEQPWQVGVEVAAPPLRFC